MPYTKRTHVTKVDDLLPSSDMGELGLNFYTSTDRDGSPDDGMDKMLTSKTLKYMGAKLDSHFVPVAEGKFREVSVPKSIYDFLDSTGRGTGVYAESGYGLFFYGKPLEVVLNLASKQGFFTEDDTFKFAFCDIVIFTEMK